MAEEEQEAQHNDQFIAESVLLPEYNNSFASDIINNPRLRGQQIIGIPSFLNCEIMNQLSILSSPGNSMYDYMRRERREKRRSKNDTEGRNYKCDKCDKTYLSYPALYTHNKTKHSAECGMLFSNPRGRGRPRKNIHREGRYDPTSPLFFRCDEKKGGPTFILSGFKEAFNFLYKFSSKYGGYEYHPLYFELYRVHMYNIDFIRYNQEFLTAESWLAPPNFESSMKKKVEHFSLEPGFLQLSELEINKAQEEEKSQIENREERKEKNIENLLDIQPKEIPEKMPEHSEELKQIIPPDQQDSKDIVERIVENETLPYNKDHIEVISQPKAIHDFNVEHTKISSSEIVESVEVEKLVEVTQQISSIADIKSGVDTQNGILLEKHETNRQNYEEEKIDEKDNTIKNNEEKEKLSSGILEKKEELEIIDKSALEPILTSTQFQVPEEMSDIPLGPKEPEFLDSEMKNKCSDSEQILPLISNPEQFIDVALRPSTPSEPQATTPKEVSYNEPNQFPINSIIIPEFGNKSYHNGQSSLMNEDPSPALLKMIELEEAYLEQRQVMKCDEIFAEYLDYVARIVKREVYVHIVKFVFLFRECLNNCGEKIKKIKAEEFSTPEQPEESTTGDFCRENGAEIVPNICNEFVANFLDETITFGNLDVADLTINLCHWLFMHGFTTSRITLFSS